MAATLLKPTGMFVFVARVEQHLHAGIDRQAKSANDMRLRVVGGGGGDRAQRCLQRRHSEAIVREDAGICCSTSLIEPECPLRSAGVVDQVQSAADGNASVQDRNADGLAPQHT